MRGATRRWAAWGALAATAAVLFGACDEDEVRPGLAGDCNDPACIEVRNGLPVTVGPGAGLPDGEAGAGGGGGMPGPGTGELVGTVFELAAADLQSRQRLMGGVEVRARRAGGGVADPVRDETDPGGAFRLEGILTASVTWVGVGDFASPPVEPYIDTLQAVDATRGERVNLLVARRDALSNAVSIAFLDDPVELELDRAHVVVRFIRASGTPVEGLALTFPAPGQVPIAYDAGDAFSSALDATSSRGMALLVNLQAAPYPGSNTTLIADLDGVPLAVDLQIAAGALTVVSAVVPDP